MSSKAIGQQQQGRRTPLSLAGTKQNHHQQQNQSNFSKANHNLAKNQEPKDSTSNKNNNQTAKNQNETREPTPNQKETRKNQQNGNKNVSADNSGDSVIFVEQNGTANGNSDSNNGVMPNKNSGITGKATNQSASKDNNKDKNKDKQQPETVKEKPEQKSKKSDGAKATEKKQNEVTENQTTASPSVNAIKSKDRSSTPTKSPSDTDKKANEKTTTPEKSDTTSNAKQNSITTSKTEKTEKTEKAAASAAATPPRTPVPTPSKSSKAAEKTSEVVEENEAENDIEPLIVESSPPKKTTAIHTLAPAATSTPGKAIDGKRSTNAKSEIQITMETRRGKSVDRKSVPRSYSDISGRRSIRTHDEFTPSMYNSKFRETYRRINTELDVADHTNTSMNVTVGSEIPNNSSFLSFSLFGRGRKRERTPPPVVPDKSQSAVELTMETTPPKRARLDVHGIFSVMSSPLTMLRTRFSKTTLQTPVKDKKPLTLGDDVQNVSGVSIEEVATSAEVTATEDITVGEEVVLDKTSSKVTPVKGRDEADVGSGDAKTTPMDTDDDIKITETPLIPAVGEPKMKQKGCLVM